eukprot:Rhum_TRINITY_DN8430_c0_g1::Rhum_TRINITY_DN8430_c0_g1_i1::g.27855::m.27855
MGAFGTYDVPVAQLAAVAERCAAVLARYEALHATHADDFFVAQPWDRIADIADARTVRAAAEALTDAECTSLPELPQGTDGPLRELLDVLASCSLPHRETADLSALGSDGPAPPAAPQRPPAQRKGFTPKKEHEVDRFAGAMQLLLPASTGGGSGGGGDADSDAAAAALSAVDSVVNVGEGRGHLSEVLALALRGRVRRIIGLDCEEALCAASRERATHAASKRPHGDAVRRDSLLCRVTPALCAGDYAALVGARTGEALEEGLRRSAVVGLHACGDLGSTVTRLFAESDAPLYLLAPCCYHALSDEGFPMSDVLAARSVRLGVVSRMLGCAPVDRWSAAAAAERLPGLRLGFYRAVLSAALHPRRLQLAPSRYRRLAKTAGLTLEAFVAAALEEEEEEEERARVAAAARAADTEANFRAYLAFACLRRCFAAAVEAVLLLDRVLFLKQHVAHAALVPLFDSTISPRRFVVVATR